jgi:RNA polymerase sigma factor (TIGR02999 family)
VNLESPRREIPPISRFCVFNLAVRTSKLSPMSDVTQLLLAIQQGQPHATNDLFPLVYEELKKLARISLLREKPGQTLQPTALVHEAFVRLVDSENQQRWDSRGHFFMAAAEAMRRILVENARRKARLKHGGKFERVDLLEVDLPSDAEDKRLMALDEALARLEAEDPKKAQLVKLKYFAGMPLDEAANALEISRATASRYWTYARAWLYDAVADD